MKKLITICAGLIFSAMLILACSTSENKNVVAQSNTQQNSSNQITDKKSSPTSAPTEPIPVKAETLIDECLKDDAAFKQKYSDLATQGTKLKVTGKITGTFPGKVLLGKNIQGSFVACSSADSSDNSFSKLKTGQEVTLIGAYSSGEKIDKSVAFIMLNQCQLQ